jgi:hypothetical protein
VTECEPAARTRAGLEEWGVIVVTLAEAAALPLLPRPRWCGGRVLHGMLMRRRAPAAEPLDHNETGSGKIASVARVQCAA